MKKITLLILVIAVMCLLCGCNDKTPPTLDVACSTDGAASHQEATLGSYGWSWFGGGVQSDSPGPLDMEKNGSLTSFTINADQCNITITFAAACKSFTVYGEIIPDGKQETVASDVTDTRTYAFTAKAGYVYSVIADFDQGDAVYAFSVRPE